MSWTTASPPKPLCRVCLSSPDGELHLRVESALAEFTGGRDARFRNAPEECISYLEAKVGDMDDMRGKWTRFEYYVRWSENDDGLIEVYRDGKNVLIHNGRNCRKIQNCLSRNLHYYGIYKPNNEVLSGVVPATVFYRNVSMSQTRDELTR